MDHTFSELREFESRFDQAAKFGDVTQECLVEGRACQLPIYSLRLGSKDVLAPTLAIVGGIHGLERIGTRVVLAHLQHILESLHWDESLNELLATCRLLFYPLANPSGMLNGTRCNQAGIDLMRNAPVDRASGSKWNLLAGHRISPLLPWFRGHGDHMEKEALALISFCQREVSRSVFSIAIDVHSGFGFRDRLWFPYAKDRAPIHHVAEVYALRKLLRRSHRHHVYKVEPQCQSYTANGDLWDYIYDRHRVDHPNHIFLPLCLEMGSWNWVRKNPRQMLSANGFFNPIIDHREHRTLRRHISLFDFLLRAVRSHRQWLGIPSEQIEVLRRKAILKWYP